MPGTGGAGNGLDPPRNVVLKLTLMLLAVYLVGMAAQIGHNIGRVGALITPIVAVYTALYLAEIEQRLGGERTRTDRSVRSDGPPPTGKRSSPASN